MEFSRGGAIGKAGLLAFMLACGCSDQQAKGLGQMTESGAKAGASALAQAAQVLGKGVQSVKQGLSEAELSGKVHARILWDKPLANSPFSIDAQPGGIVKLTGNVETEELHRRLLDLVGNTVGVREVIDGVQIGQAAPRDSQPRDARDFRDGPLDRGNRGVDATTSREEFVPRR